MIFQRSQNVQQLPLFIYNQINVIPQHGIPKAAAQRANLAGKESKKKKKDEKTKLEIKSTERRKYEMRYFRYLVVAHDRLKACDLRIGVCFAPAKSMSHFNSL